MNYLKKVQKQAKEIQNTVKEVEKGAASLGLSDRFNKLKSGNKADPAASDKAVGSAPADSSGEWKEVSATSTPADSSVNTPVTPASSVPASATPTSAAPGSAMPAPPVNTKPKTKLTLVQRKELRDQWEKEDKGKIEERLTAALGVPWTTQADAAILLNPKPDDKPSTIDSPGSMIYEYLNAATEKIEEFIKEMGDPAKDEINTLCPTRVLALDLDDKKQDDFEQTEKYNDWHYNRPVFQDGVFYILINRDALWSNARVAGQKLDRALIIGRASNPALANQIDAPTIASIKKYWEPEEEKLLAKARDLLYNPKLEFEPNFQATWAALDNFARTDPDQRTLDWGWREGFASGMVAYFTAFINRLEENKFKSDDLLQEGFNEVVDKNKVEFRFKDELTDAAKQVSGANEASIEDGVFCLCTTTKSWRSNEDRMGHNLMSLL